MCHQLLVSLRMSRNGKKHRYGRETKSESFASFWWQREIFNARHPQLEALLLDYRELNFRGIKSNIPTS